MIMKIKGAKTKGQDGQTAVELAVFGAVLIFMIGMIVRASLNNALQQHQALKAMRMALKTSFEYSQSLKGYYTNESGGRNGNSSRNNSNIIFIEDRLSVESNKYGSFDRIPLMMGGGGTHSRNNFYPFDQKDETHHIPRMDIFVNGVQFPFTTAGMKYAELAEMIDTDGDGIPDTKVTFDHDGDNADGVDWYDTPPVPRPRVLYTMIPNHRAFENWRYQDCYSSAELLNKATDDAYVLPAVPDDPDCDERFDLDRNGVSDEVPIPEREWFSWQWGPLFYQDIDVEDGENLIIDVDGDLIEERVVILDGSEAVIIDFNEGDLDFTLDPGPQFEQDIQMYTYVHGDPDQGEGTYLEIREGKLYPPEPGSQYIATASKKDAVDIIQRVIRLSNNTGRFCPLPAVPLPADDPIIRHRGWPDTTQMIPIEDGVPNPVEACDDCFAIANIEKTCFSTDTNILYIRSRVADLHGHKWVTKTDNDPYVSFSSTPLP